MAAPSKPPAPAAPAPARTTSGELGVQPGPRQAADPKVLCGMAAVPGPSDQVVEVVAHVTADPVNVTVGAESVLALRGPIRTRLDATLSKGEAPPPGLASGFEMELAIARFHDRAYAVARVGPGVSLGDTDESTQTGLQKVAWKLPRPC